MIQTIVSFIKRYPILCIFILSVIVYANTFTHGFVYDDAFFTQRQELRSFAHVPRVFIEPLTLGNRLAGTYRPLTIFTIGLTYSLFGESPVPFHISNVILHAVASVLVFVVARRMGMAFLVSFFGALIFAVHPVHVEAVANIKSRDEILFVMFSLVSIYTLLRVKNMRYAIPLINLSFLLALLAKEMAIVLPVLLFAIGVWKGALSKKNSVILLLSCSIPVLLYALLRYIALGEFFLGSYTGVHPANLLYEADFSTRLLTGFHIYLVYLSTLVIPVYLRASYAFKAIEPISSISNSWLWIPGAFLMIAGVVAIIVAAMKKYTHTALLLFWWHVVYVMISQIPFAKGDIVAERWMYMPSVPFVLLLSGVLFRIIRNKNVYLGIMGSIILLLFLRTVIRNPVWASNLTLFSSMVRDAPESVVARTLLAHENIRQRNISDAIKHAEVAESIYPDYAQLQNVLGNLATLDKRYDQAEQYFIHSRSLEPGLVQTYALLGSLYYAQGEYEKSLQEFSVIVEKNQLLRFEDIVSYAAVTAKLGRYQESINILSTLTPENQLRPQAMFLFAVNYYKLGNQEKLLNYIRWNPSHTREEREKILHDF